jgi:hypothetical protein
VRIRARGYLRPEFVQPNELLNPVKLSCSDNIVGFWSTWSSLDQSGPLDVVLCCTTYSGVPNGVQKKFGATSYKNYQKDSALSPRHTLSPFSLLALIFLGRDSCKNYQETLMKTT